MFSERLSTPSAASFIASDSDGCAWQIMPMSSAEPRNSIATTASAISSPANGPDDVHAEDLVGLRVGDEFDQPGGVAQRPRPRVGREGKHAGAVLDARRLELLLGLAHPGDLGRGVDHRRDGVEVEVRLLAGDALGHHHALLLGLVGEHRSAHHVADRPDIRQVGPAIVVHGDEAPLIQLQAHAGSIQSLRIRNPADRNDEPVALQCFG